MGLGGLPGFGNSHHDALDYTRVKCLKRPRIFFTKALHGMRIGNNIFRYIEPSTV